MRSTGRRKKKTPLTRNLEPLYRLGCFCFLPSQVCRRPSPGTKKKKDEKTNRRQTHTLTLSPTLFLSIMHALSLSLTHTHAHQGYAGGPKTRQYRSQSHVHAEPRGAPRLGSTRSIPIRARRDTKVHPGHTLPAAHLLDELFLGRFWVGLAVVVPGKVHLDLAHPGHTKGRIE